MRLGWAVTHQAWTQEVALSPQPLIPLLLPHLHSCHHRAFARSAHGCSPPSRPCVSVLLRGTSVLTVHCHLVTLLWSCLWTLGISWSPLGLGPTCFPEGELESERNLVPRWPLLLHMERTRRCPLAHGGTWLTRQNLTLTVHLREAGRGGSRTWGFRGATPEGDTSGPSGTPPGGVRVP